MWTKMTFYTLFMLVSLYVIKREFVEGYTFFLKSKAIGGENLRGRDPPAKRLPETEKSKALGPECKVPQLEEAIREAGKWPEGAGAFYVNESLANEKHKLGLFGPKGSEILDITFVKDSSVKLMFRNREGNKTKPTLIPSSPPNPGTAEDSVLNYKFDIKSDVIGVKNLKVVNKTGKKLGIGKNNTVAQLQGAIKAQGLWPGQAKTIYINERNVMSTAQKLVTFAPGGNETMTIDFVTVDSSITYTFLVENGESLSVFNSLSIRPSNSVSILARKLKVAKLWPNSTVKMMINGSLVKYQVKISKNGEVAETHNYQIRDYKQDGLVKIEFQPVGIKAAFAMLEGLSDED